MRALYWLTLTLTALWCGCRCNPQYCDEHVGHNCEAPLLTMDGQQGCMMNAQCIDPKAPVCDTTTSSCVECTSDQPAACKGATPVCGPVEACVQCTMQDSAACSGTTPICGPSNTCEKCTQHAQCVGSNVCLPDGSCANVDDVAYVVPGSTGAAPCTQAAPCGLLDQALQADKAIVKMATGLVKDSKTTTIENRTVTILAEAGARLDRDLDGPILEIKASSDVRIYDLEITGASGTAGADGIDVTAAGGTPSLLLVRATVSGNNGVGISASGGTLTVTQSTVSHNSAGGIFTSGGVLTVSQSTVSSNDAGGIKVSGAEFEISNSFIVTNGNATSLFGGVNIDGISTTSSMHKLEFDTVSGNVGPGTVNTGITCGTVLTPIVFTNSIIYANVVSMGGKQVGGSVSCSATYSDIGPDTLAGSGNITMDPMFVNPTENDFRLQATSTARNAADPASTASVDFNGDDRPQEGRSDMGADEFHP